MNKFLAITNKFIGVLALLAVMLNTQAQLVTIPAANTAGTGGGAIEYRKPLGAYWGHERTALIYTPAEIGTSGNITSVGFYVDALLLPAASTPVTIYMKQVASPTFAAATTVAAEETGATLVFNGTVTSAQLTVGAWTTLTLTAPFAYNGTDNLEVIVETNGGGTGIEDLDSKQFRYNPTTGNTMQYWQADNTPPTGTGTVGTYRKNIQLNFSAGASCTGQPDAGTTNSSVNSACPAQSFTLSLTGNTTGTGITYQWISSANGTSYTNIGGAISSVYSATISANTYFRCIVTCTNSGLIDTSTVNLVTINAFSSCYCTPAITDCTLDDAILNVTFAGINNTTTCSTNGYGQYPTPTASVMQGTGYPISVEVGPGGTEYVSVWIDYNQNGIFDANEHTDLGSGNGVVLNGNILIPGNALAGVTGMRVRVRYNVALTSADACLGTFTFGETEDYLVNITASSPCTTPTDAGVISGPTTGACDSFYLYTTNAYVGDLQWQYSNTGANGPWIDLTGSINDSVAITAAAAGTYYIRLYATQAGCSDDSSNVIAITLTKLGDDVCSAIDLAFGANGPYYVEGATTQVGEPTPPGGTSCNSLDGWCSFNAVISNTLWFKFTAPASGRVSLRAPGYDTQLALWDALNCNAVLTGGATLVAANDDDTLYVANGVAEFSSYIDSAICLTPGKTYYVQLDPYTADDPAGTEIILTDLGAGPNASFTNLAPTYCTGAAAVTLVPATAGGTFSGPGVSGNVFTPANAGVGGPYVISYTFYACYKSSDTVTSVSSGPSVSLFSATNVACFGGTTGAIDMSVSGGSGNFTYNWNNGTQTQDLTGVAAGTYTLSVTDNTGGCTAIGSPVTLTQPVAPITPALDSIVNVKCNGANTGGIYVTITGGTAPYSYLWSNGSISQDLTGVAAGSYQGTITDANFCTYVSQLIPVSQPSALLLVLDSVRNNNCGGTGAGAVYVSLTGGTTPYTYNWSNGATSQDITGLAANTYTVSVQDANGCTVTSVSGTVTAGSALTLTLDSVKNSTCAGADNGAVYVTLSGGTLPYNYNWSNGATSQDITGLAANTYAVSVQDANGCTATPVSGTVTAGLSLVLTLDSVKSSSCAGVDNGAVYVTLSGGTLPYTYNWSNGASSQDITGLAANAYTVSVQDANGCTASPVSGTVTNGLSLVITLDSVTNTSCAGADNGAVYVTLTGGSLPYTYNWSNGTHNQDLTAVGAGAYTLSVNDVNGCTATPLSGTVADGAVNITVTLDSAQDVTCNGLANGSISISVSGGTAGYGYNWTGGATTQDVTGLSSGNYTVTVNDATNCTTSFGPVSVAEPTVVVLTLDSVQGVSCFGNSNGAVFTTGGGGTAPSTLVWSNTQSAFDITNLSAGSYSATLTDANGCSASVSANVTQPSAALSGSATTTDEVQGGTLGSVNLSVSGGTAAYTYNWSNGATTEDLAAVAAGTYTCTVTDANGCSTTVSATVSFITGISKVQNNFAVSVYPNPTQNNTFITLNLNTTENVSVEIYNLGGQLIQQFTEGNVINTTFEVNFGNQAAGVYYAKVKAGNATATVRIVVSN